MKKKDIELLSEKIKNILSNESYFKKEFVTDKSYLKYYRLHSRVCGLLAKAGIELGYLVDMNRRLEIEPIPRKTKTGKDFFW